MPCSITLNSMAGKDPYLLVKRNKELLKTKIEGVGCPHLIHQKLYFLMQHVYKTCADVLSTLPPQEIFSLRTDGVAKCREEMIIHHPCSLSNRHTFPLYCHCYPRVISHGWLDIGGEEREEDAGTLFGMDEDQSIPSSEQPTREKSESGAF
jgi:hypothetical protein